MSHPQYVNIYVWGSNNATSYLHSKFNLCSNINVADIIILLYKSDFIYNELCELITYIKQGVPYIVGNIDLTYPDKQIVKPDTGSIYNMIISITGIQPLWICGKPNVGICDIRSDKKYIMVGDSLLTDAKLAENMNIHFFHKTDVSDLGVLLTKLRLSR
jgi:ribonucleotide monophosphatase NagD (HAD superfamily)